MTKDINSATAEELAQVPLITPARAEAIVDWREQHGQIGDMAELMEVPGIGHRTVEQMTERFTASGTQQDDEPEEGEEGEGEDGGEGGPDEDENGGEEEGEEEDGDGEDDNAAA